MHCGSAHGSWSNQSAGGSWTEPTFRPPIVQNQPKLHSQFRSEDDFSFQVLESITKCPRSIFLDFTLGAQRAQAQPPHRSSCPRKGQRRTLTHLSFWSSL